MFNILIGYRRWLLDKLFEEILLEDSSSGFLDGTHHCNKTRSSTITRVSDVSIVSHSELRHCVVLRELSVCHATADSYHSNYNAWNHRIWVMDSFTCCRMQVCNIPSIRGGTPDNLLTSTLPSSTLHSAHIHCTHIPNYQFPSSPWAGALDRHKDLGTGVQSRLDSYPQRMNERTTGTIH